MRSDTDAQAQPSRRRLIAIIGWGVVFAVIPVMLLSLGVELTLHFGGVPIDGPFQLYNPLRRIMAGQRGGVDFQFFHGLGIPYLTYVPFRLFGGSFVAAELSRQLIAALSGLVVIPAFLRAFTSDWRRIFALSTAVLAALIALDFAPMVLAVGSLLPLRTAVPTLTPLIWMLPFRPRWKSALAGVAIGCSVLLGTEQGMALLAAFLIVSAIVACRSPAKGPAMWHALMTVGVAALTFAILVLAIGGPAGLRGAVNYNLKLVPMDQYWYFGVPPNAFAANLATLRQGLIDEWIILPTVLSGVAVSVILLRRLWREHTGRTGDRNVALAISMLYGLISCASLLGILTHVYVGPCVRTILMIGALEVDARLRRREASPSVVRTGRRIPALVVIAGLSLLVMATWVPLRLFSRGHSASKVRSFALALPHLISEHAVPRRGMVFDSIWPATLSTSQSIIDAHRGPDGTPPTLWSTYAGLLEARNGIFHPSVDYIIHALGPAQRAQYVEDFRTYRPTLVQTVRPTFTEYETWIEQTSWDFYLEVLRNYRVIGLTPWSTFWERLPAPVEEPPAFFESSVNRGARSLEVVLPAATSTFPDTVLVQVELTYRAHNPLRGLPVFGALPRYLVRLSGAVPTNPVTLDPYTTTARFPVVGPAGRRVTFGLTANSLLPGASLEVTGIRAWQIAITPAITPWLRDLTAASSPNHRFR